MSKIIFIEGIIDENDKSKPPEPSNTYCAKNYRDKGSDVDGGNNKTDNTNA